MTSQGVTIDPTRYAVLSQEFEKPYFVELKQRLLEEKRSHVIYPPSALIFSAYDLTPFNQVRVVILGQDPYHGVGQAMGLSFSVPAGCALPPSLKNIYKEIQEDIGAPSQCSLQAGSAGDLTARARQGVLLLNAFLTVRAGEPASHQKLGWEHFTDATIRAISAGRDHVVFILRGNFAKSKRALIDESKHVILDSAHPSPFSVHQGFFGSKCFSRCNEVLRGRGAEEILR